MSSEIADLATRVEDRISAWQLTVERFAETETSILAFGRRADRPVVLKVTKRLGEDWLVGQVLAAFDGRGVVGVYEHVDGAILLERLSPARSLATLSVNGADDEATTILAETIRAMPSCIPPRSVPTSEDWGKSFDRYVASGDSQIPRLLVSQAQQVYAELCRSQTDVRLLHGDLHHDNVLFDDTRGWLAVDPKGVVGEIEYEVAAALRNPYEAPDLFADPSIIQRRVERLSRELDLDAERILAWTFAQAVLAVVWMLEDGIAIERGDRWIALARRTCD